MKPVEKVNRDEPPASVPESVPTSWREAKLSTLEIECPPAWVASFIDKIPQTNEQFRKDPVAYLKARAGRREFRLPDFECNAGNAFLESSSSVDNANLEYPGKNDMIISMEQWVCTKLCVSALALNMKLSGMSNELYLGVTQALEQNRAKIREDHYRVIQYFLDSMRLSVEFLKENLSSDKMEKFQGRWEKDIKTSALVSFVKGIIASLLGLEHDVALGHFRNAVKLEPDCHLWPHILGEKLKHMRVSGGGKQNMPSSEELGACQKAHELCPENVKYMLDLAALKLQKLNGSGGKAQGTVQELDGILKLLRLPKYSQFQSRGRAIIVFYLTADEPGGEMPPSAPQRSPSPPPFQIYQPELAGGVEAIVVEHGDEQGEDLEVNDDLVVAEGEGDLEGGVMIDGEVAMGMGLELQAVDHEVDVVGGEEVEGVADVEVEEQEVADLEHGVFDADDEDEEDGVFDADDEDEEDGIADVEAEEEGGVEAEDEGDFEEEIGQEEEDEMIESETEDEEDQIATEE